MNNDIEDPVVEVVEPVQVPESGGITSAEAKLQSSRLDRVGARLATEPKVRVRLQEDTSVFIDGYPLFIQGKVWVEVPQTAAEILEQAGRY